MIRNVVEYLQESASKYPDKTALIDEHRSMTFKELDIKAQKLASAIAKQCGYIKNRPIAVCMTKGIECIVAFLGIAYSGNFYCPLDPKSPIDRINRILNVLEPIAVVYRDKALDGMICSGQEILYEKIEKQSINVDAVMQYQKVLDIDPLYILFTSGSTGQPKGVVISHKGVIDYIEWLYYKFSFSEKTIFGNQAPFYFDNSILDIYSTLKNGATMVVIPEKLFMFPQLLLEFVNKYKINTLFWVPSALIVVANSGILDKVYMDALEKVLFAGEVMPNKQLNVWRKHYPNIQYANLYGPTEITDICTYYIVNREFRDDEDLPIGYACENTEILVLNEQDKLVEDNEIGELCVRGTGIAMGYYGDYEKTDKVFVQNPLNSNYRDIIYRTGDLVKYNEYGEIIYLSRKDFQIKHQGHRIELGEIETMANSLEGIDHSCAIYDDINKKIVLFCITSKGLSEKQIYKLLADKIPKYMLPTHISILDQMPLNINGKIDRVKLKSFIEVTKNERVW